MVKVICLTEEQLWERLDPSIEEAGMTREQFIAEGEADELEDPNLRDLWIAHGGFLTE